MFGLEGLESPFHGAGPRDNEPGSPSPRTPPALTPPPPPPPLAAVKTSLEPRV